jgi:hypothetical protein
MIILRSSWFQPDYKTSQSRSILLARHKQLYRQQGVERHPASAGHGCPARESSTQVLDSSGASPEMRRTRDVETVQESTFTTSC